MAKLTSSDIETLKELGFKKKDKEYILKNGYVRISIPDSAIFLHYGKGILKDESYVGLDSDKIHDIIKYAKDNITKLKEYDNNPSFEKADKMVNKVMRKVLDKKVHASTERVFSYNGQKIVASSKEEAILEILALKEEDLNPYTKALYEVMNEGSFQYNYRTDDNFTNFMKTTMLDEVKDVIKSDKRLIKQCVERRVKSHSIVWNALFQIFSYVKKMHNCRAVINNYLMKRWFEFNHTDYKTALKPIVDYVETELRPELRETEKVTSATKHNIIEELCDLAKKDKNKADAIFKTLTKDYNTSLDCMLASQYLAKEFKYDVKNADFWVQGFRKLYEEKGVDFLCTVLRDLKLGSSPIGCGACNSILKSLYNKFIGVKAMADTECLVYYREPENMSVFLPLDKDNVITHS